MAVDSAPVGSASSPSPTIADSRAGSALKIVLVEFLPSGGMFQFTFQFGQALAEQGHEVLLLTGPDAELRSNTPGFEVVEIFPTWHPTAEPGGSGLRRKARRISRALLLAESWRRATRFIRLVRPDIAQFGELRYPLDSGMFRLLARALPRHGVGRCGAQPAALRRQRQDGVGGKGWSTHEIDAGGGVPGM